MSAAVESDQVAISRFVVMTCLGHGDEISPPFLVNDDDRLAGDRRRGVVGVLLLRADEADLVRAVARVRRQLVRVQALDRARAGDAAVVDARLEPDGEELLAE